MRTSSSMLACVLPGTAAPARYGQAELGHQPVREPPAAGSRHLEPGQQYRQGAPAYLHPGSRWQIDFTPTIAPQNRTGCLVARYQFYREHRLR